MSKIRLFATAALLAGTVALVGADKPAMPCARSVTCSKQATNVDLRIQVVEVSEETGAMLSRCFEDGCAMTDGRTLQTGNPHILDRKHFMLLLAAAQNDCRFNVIQAPQLIAQSGHQEVIQIQDMALFNTGVSVELNNGKPVATPKQTAAATSGICIRVKPTISADHKSVNVDLSLEDVMANSSARAATQVTVEIKSNGTGSATVGTYQLQEPNCRTFKMNGCSSAPNGKTILFDAGVRERECCLDDSLPILRRIPGMRCAFRDAKRKHETDHVFVLVTPTIQCEGPTANNDSTGTPEQDATTCSTRDESSKSIVKVYAVADLVVPVPGMTGAFPGMEPTRAKCNQCQKKDLNVDQEMCVVPVPIYNSPPEIGGCCGLLAALCPPAACEKETREDVLLKAITTTIRPGCWKCAGGDCTIDYSPVGMALVVNAPAETQEQVAALIANLRKFQDVNLTFEMRFITVPEEFFEQFGLDVDMSKTPCPRVIRETRDGLERVGVDFECCDGERCSEPNCKSRAVPITDIQAHLLLEAVQGERRANVLHAPKITTLNAQQATISMQDQQTFVTSVTVEADGDQTRVVPKNTTVTTGLNISLLPMLSADRRFVSLHLQAKHTYPVGSNVPMVPVTTQIRPKFEGGFVGEPIPFTQYIQQPKFNTLTCDSHMMIPDGGTMLIDGGRIDREVCCASEANVPVLARIPYLNRLFRKVSVGCEHVTEHMLIMVTPRVICPVAETAKGAMQTGCCKSQGGCGATATSHSGCKSGCCKTACCDSGCCKSGCCEKCGKPGKVAVFEEESTVAPAPPPVKAAAQAVKKSPVEQRAEKMAAKLVQKYHEACANGEPEKARRYGRQALDLDPECFGKMMIQQTYQKMPQPPDVKAAELINQCDDFGPLKRPELKPNEFSDRPSHLTPERVHGSIQ